MMNESSGGVRASVALASYNGEKYIERQLRTILDSLGPFDELVVSDDGSVDQTRKIVQDFCDSDPRVRLVDGPCKGIKQNFANAIAECRGRYIFLSDQDNIWYKEKVERVLAEFEKSNCAVVVHDCRITGEGDRILHDSYYMLRNSKPGVWANILKNHYVGCCMAFDAVSLKDRILPIPDNIHMHDQWIGILGEVYGSSVFIPDKLMDFCRHGDNNEEINKHYGLWVMLRNRLTFIRELNKRKRSLRSLPSVGRSR